MKVDMHVHTSASRCSNMAPLALEKAAIRAGLDGVVVTDHNTQSGYKSARKVCRKIRIYPGVEVSTRGGEVIALFFEGDIEKGLQLGDAVRLIREAGGLAVLPHPFDFLRSGAGRTKIRPDAVEVFNSRCLLPVFNRMAERFASENKIQAVCGSDAHFPIEVGRSVVETGGDFEECVRKKKVRIIRKKYSPPTAHLQTILAKLL